MFANRFSFLHPELVEAACIGSPGDWPILPIKELNNNLLRYPVGTSDWIDVTGESFKTEEIKKVNFNFFIGDKDINDSVLFDDSFELQDREFILKNFGNIPVDRFRKAIPIMKENGLNLIYKEYKNVEHTVNQEMHKDIFDFLIKYSSE